MKDTIPYFLHEAVLSLYAASADGMSASGVAIWSGELATGLRMEVSFDEVKLQGAGERYTSAHPIDEEHLIEVERTWLIRRSAPADFVPSRQQPYVLELVWYEPEQKTWYQRRYVGVTPRRVQWQSVGTNQFGTHQVWRARQLVQGGGVGQPFTPLPVAPGAVQVVPFFRETPLIWGDYLLGVYCWPTAARLGLVRAVAWASQGQDTVLGLEVDSALTGDTVRLPSGPANTEVSGTADLTHVQVPAGSVVRWKIMSGPIPEAAAWACALTMGITPS